MQVCDENKLFVASLVIALGFLVQNLLWPSFAKAEGDKQVQNDKQEKKYPPPVYSVKDSLANKVGIVGGHMT